MPYQSGKTYGHELGLSCAFRQWRATHSHCSKLHGYAISAHIEFAGYELDPHNWIVDFGGMKPIKEFLKETFDHKTVVAEDDPELDAFTLLDKAGIIDLVVLPHVGCEAFAEHVGRYVEKWIDERDGDRVELLYVTIHEHGANSATWRPDALAQTATMSNEMNPGVAK